MALGSGPQLTSCFSFSQLNSNFWRIFNTDTLLTTQAEELSNGITFGYIDSYGKVSETGVPLDRSYYVFVKKKNENYIQLTLYDVSTDTIYFRTKSAGTWKDWNANSLKSDLDQMFTFTGITNALFTVTSEGIMALKFTNGSTGKTAQVNFDVVAKNIRVYNDGSEVFRITADT